MQMSKSIAFLAAAASARTQVADLQRPMLPDDLAVAYLAAKRRIRDISIQVRLVRELSDAEAALEAVDAAGAAFERAHELLLPAVERGLALVRAGACDSTHLAALQMIYPDGAWVTQNAACREMRAQLEEARSFDYRKLGIAPTTFPPPKPQNHNTTTP